MKTILTLFLVITTHAFDLHVFNATKTNAVLAIAGREFEILGNEEITVRGATGVVSWLTETGTTVATIDLGSEVGDRGEAILCGDGLGGPDIMLTTFAPEWLSHWEWYLGGFGLGMAGFFYAFKKRAISQLVGGGDHGE